MNVNFDGRTYSFEVKPGIDGYKQFTEAIRRAFSLPDDSELNITFTCDEPSSGTGPQGGSLTVPSLLPSPTTAGSLLTLQGAGAYDAAVHCASVSAARRMQHHPGQRSTSGNSGGGSGSSGGGLMRAGRSSPSRGAGGRAAQRDSARQLLGDRSRDSSSSPDRRQAAAAAGAAGAGAIAPLTPPRGGAPPPTNSGSPALSSASSTSSSSSSVGQEAVAGLGNVSPAGSTGSGGGERGLGGALLPPLQKRNGWRKLKTICESIITRNKQQ